MTIRYECQKCGSVLRIKQDRAGQKGKCPKCQVRFIIPVPDETAAAKSNARANTASELLDEDDLVAAYLSDESVKKSDESAKKPRSQKRTVSFETTDEEKKLKPRLSGHALSKASGSASGSAGELLATANKKDREAKSDNTGPIDKEKIKSLTTEIFREYGQKTILPVVGIFFAALLLYWVSSPAWSKKRELPQLVKLNGVVTLNDKPLEGARVAFCPMNNSQAGNDIPLSSSYGKTDGAGRFTLKYTHEIDGVAVGLHQVKITMHDQRGRQILPVTYNIASTLSRQVKFEGNPPLKFELFLNR